ncbi:MAG TPA: PQQ-dependent sugar dehydrogenase [Bacteroidia bacterium]|nr:PQQ-dependent sugar dehydrogenase [Bacteroidia bacterium]
MKLRQVLIILIVFLFNRAAAQLVPVPFVPSVSRVTDIKHCGDDRLFIVEQVGRIRISDLNGNLLIRPFLDIDPEVNSTGTEQGLLGLAFSPDYATDGFFYVDYVNNLNNTVISRFHVSDQDPDSADVMSEEILFTVQQPFTNHNGGNMQFGPDGFLYISFGDGGSAGDPMGNGQNLQTVLGKILRINVSQSPGYTIPASNPFYGSSDADERIWAFGLRNPWRASFDRLTGDFWIADVGQALREEIDLEYAGTRGGNNYGWRCYEGTLPYNTSGCLSQQDYAAPVFEYGHGPACSITGGYVYRGAVYGQWYGTYFFTDYCSGEIRGLNADSTGNFTPVSFGFFSQFDYTTFGEDKYGEMYLGSFYHGLFKLAGDSCHPVAHISYRDTLFVNGPTYLLNTPYYPGFTYQWYRNGAAIAGATNNSYNATERGNYKVTTTNTIGCSSVSETVVVWLIGNGSEVTVFPNPGSGVIQLSSQLFTSGSSQVEVYDQTGQLVLSKKITATSTGIVTFALPPDLSKGVYCFRITSANAVVNKKVVIGTGY